MGDLDAIGFADNEKIFKRAIGSMPKNIRYHALTKRLTGQSQS
jgi:hypothetical protein